MRIPNERNETNPQHTQRFTQKLNQNQALKLSLYQQTRLQKHWNKVNTDPIAFTPYELREITSEAESYAENEKLAAFVKEHMQAVFAEALTTHTPSDRIIAKEIIAAVGSGKGYDLDWTKYAISAGFHPWWIDVSEVACKVALKRLRVLCQRMINTDDSWKAAKLEPVVYHGEIQTILADPSSVTAPPFNPRDVSIWYFCRTFTCLAKKSAPIVLKLLGEASLSENSDPFKSKRIEIISAFKDDNPTRVGKSSKLYMIDDLAAHLSIGASRPVKAVLGNTYLYFGTQVYRAVSFMAA